MQNSALQGQEAPLTPPRTQLPSVVIVENVNDPEAVSGLTSVILGILGYEWPGDAVSPLDAGIPMERPFFF